MATVFERWTWLVDAVIVVGVVVGVAVLVRSFRVPVWAPVLAMAAAFVTILSWVFSSGHELAGVTGGYFENDRVVDPAPLAQDDALARRLWEESERLTGLVPDASKPVAPKPVAATEARP